MKRYLRTANLLYLGVVFATATSAQVVVNTVVAHNSVLRLITSGDAIVVGTAKAMVVGDTASATITVEKVLKGSIESGALVSAMWTVSQLPRAPVNNVRSVHGLFFLRDAGNGEWRLMPVVAGGGWFNTSEETPATVPTDIAAAAAASLPANPSVVDRVALELVTAVESGGSSSFLNILSVAREMPSPVFNAAFRRFVAGGKTPLVCIGAAGLLLVGDPAVPIAIRDNYPAWSSMPGWRWVILQMMQSYVTTDSQALTALGSLATNEKVPAELRIAAATALAAIHSPQTLEFLAPLLDDPNTKLEAAAVGGLSMFANNVPVRGHEPAAGPWKYRTDDTMAHSVFDEGVIRQRGAYYIQFWKDWWVQNQSSLSQ